MQTQHQGKGGVSSGPAFLAALLRARGEGRRPASAAGRGDRNIAFPRRCAVIATGVFATFVGGAKGGGGGGVFVCILHAMGIISAERMPISLLELLV